MSKTVVTINHSDAVRDNAVYAESLEQWLNERFPGRDFSVNVVVGGRTECPGDDEVTEAIRDLHAGDAWTRLDGV